jgi:dienelactone hydrolase
MELLTLLLLLEIVLMFYRIKTRSMQRVGTTTIRIASIFLLFMFVTFSIITWGLRYYALALILVILVVVNIIGYCRKRKMVSEYKCSSILLKAVSMSILFFIALLPVHIFPEYQPLSTTGEYQVETITKYLTDESRIETYTNTGEARKLAVEFWYPVETEGSFPFVVFSHGAFGTRTSNESLFRELASHGYIIGSIDHTYQCLYTTDQKGNVLFISTEYVNEILRENAKEDKEESIALYQKWMNVRIADINFVIDTVKADADDDIFEHVDIEKIGMIGHSLGGAAALGMGRIRRDIRAVIALEAPFMCDILAVENDQFIFNSQPYTVPVLNVYSDSSWSHLTEWPQYHQNAQLLSSIDDDVHNLHISGVGHLSLTDLSLVSPILTRILNGHASTVSAEDCLRQINHECLLFLNNYLL